MKQKTLLLLAVATVGTLGLALLTQRSGQDAGATAARGRLFPELDAQLNDVAEVRVEKFGKSATLKRVGGKWILADRGGFPAKFEKVKELAVRVATLEIDEQKTAKKENHAKLGVEWPSKAEEGAEDAEAGLIVLKDAGGKELAAVVTGRTEWMGSKPKLFARRLAEDRVYLCEPQGSLDVVVEAKNWIDPEIVKLDNERVQAVSIVHADGERVDITRSATNHTQFAVQGVPPGRTERYEGIGNGVAQALGYGLQLEDVRPVTEVDFTKEPLAKTSFQSVDGLELAFELARFEDKTWARVVASYTPPPEPVKAAETTPEGGEPAPAEEKPAEEPKKDVAAEASALNERLAAWAFELPSYRTDVLLRRMTDLLDEPAPPSDDSLEGVLQDIGEDPEDLGPVEPKAPATDEGASAPADDGHDH